MKLLDIFLILILLSSCFFSDEKDNKLKFVNVDVNDFLGKYSSENSLILDVRTVKEISQGYIEGATFIDFYSDDFDDKIKILNKDLTIHVYCKSGGRSKSVAEKLISSGFTQVLNLNGGFDSWKKEKKFIIPEYTNKEPEESVIYNLDSLNYIIENHTTLMYIYTKWCSPCRKMSPIVDQIKSDFNNLKVVFIDADIYPEMLKRFQSSSVPTILFLEDSKVLWKKNGLSSYKELVESINEELLVL